MHLNWRKNKKFKFWNSALALSIEFIPETIRGLHKHTILKVSQFKMVRIQKENLTSITDTYHKMTSKFLLSYTMLLVYFIEYCTAK